MFWLGGTRALALAPASVSGASDEALRVGLRNRKVQDVQAAFAAGADPTKPIQGLYDLIDDGNDVTAVNKTTTIDGKPQYTIERTNRTTGKALPATTMDADQLTQQLSMIGASPEKVAQYALMQKLEAFKQGGRGNLEDQKDDAKAKRIDQKAGITKDQIEQRGGIAKEIAGMRVAGSMSVAQLRRSMSGGGGKDPANTVFKVDTDAATGNKYAVMRDKSVVWLTGPDGKTMRGVDYDRMVNGLAGQIAKDSSAVGNTPQQNRDAAVKVLGGGKAAPAAGAKDYSGLWK